MNDLELLELAKKLELNDFRKLIHYWNKEHLVNGQEAINITQEFLNIMIDANYRKVAEFREHACEAETAFTLLAGGKTLSEKIKSRLRPHVDKFKNRSFFRWDWLYE